MATPGTDAPLVGGRSRASGNAGKFNGLRVIGFVLPRSRAPTNQSKQAGRIGGAQLSHKILISLAFMKHMSIGVHARRNTARTGASSLNTPAATAAARRSMTPGNCVTVLARKPGALRKGAPFKDWLLPTAIEKMRRKLADSEDGDRQMVAILAAVLSDGLPAVEAACAQAISEGVHSADVIINILGRQRDPGLVAPIFTPGTLRLRHKPVADCARYDRLMRA